MTSTFRNLAAVVVLACLAGLFVGRAEAAKESATAEGADAGKLVEASLLADADALTPGGTMMLGVRLKMAPHWHTYWINPGETGQATQIELTGPAGAEFGPVQWPVPTRIDAPGGMSFGYEDEVLLMIPMTLPAGTKAGGEATITAEVSWLVCKEACTEGGAKLSVKLPVSASPGQPANRELFETWRARLPVEADEALAAAAIEKVEQPAAGGSGRLPQIDIKWKQAPRKVEWFPVATRAVAIDNVKVSHEGQATQIAFEPTVYKADALRDGRVDSVLVFEDAEGRRVGVAVPITVPVPAAK